MEELLKKLNMNVKEFSELYKIPYNTILQWKNGTRKPPIYVLKLIEENIELKKQGIQITIEEIEQYNELLVAKGVDQTVKDTAKKFSEKVSQAIVTNTYPYFDKDGKPVNIWKAVLGFDEIDKICKEFTEVVYYDLTKKE